VSSAGNSPGKSALTTEVAMVRVGGERPGASGQLRAEGRQDREVRLRIERPSNLNDIDLDVFQASPHRAG
jgi:hypothetical protein